MKYFQNVTQIEPTLTTMLGTMKRVFRGVFHVMCVDGVHRNTWTTVKEHEKKERKNQNNPNVTQIEPTSRMMFGDVKTIFGHVLSCGMCWGSVSKPMCKWEWKKHKKWQVKTSLPWSNKMESSVGDIDTQWWNGTNTVQNINSCRWNRYCVCAQCVLTLPAREEVDILTESEFICWNKWAAK
jgi:hypothetical protein